MQSRQNPFLYSSLWGGRQVVFAVGHFLTASNAFFGYWKRLSSVRRSWLRLVPSQHVGDVLVRMVQILHSEYEITQDVFGCAGIKGGRKVRLIVL